MTVDGPGAAPDAGAVAALVRRTMTMPVDARVAAMAAAIAGRHGAASLAVLFYGSCLREVRLDGLMLDFYLIVTDYPAAYGGGWLARANALVPPNVHPFEHGGLVAKYAVLDLRDFRRLCGRCAGDVSVFARFAQPTRLAWSAGQEAGTSVMRAAARAPATLAHHARDAVDGDDPLALWRTAFQRTYACELRAERNGRGIDIVGNDAGYYTALSHAVATDEPTVDAVDCATIGRTWAAFRRRGKALSVMRLAKASATFAGGIDYLAWKINRHAGTRITITPWQRRHPLLAAMTLVPRLLRQGAIR